MLLHKTYGWIWIFICIHVICWTWITVHVRSGNVRKGFRLPRSCITKTHLTAVGPSPGYTRKHRPGTWSRDGGIPGVLGGTDKSNTSTSRPLARKLRGKNPVYMGEWGHSVPFHSFLLYVDHIKAVQYVCLGGCLGICVLCNKEQYSMKYRSTFITTATFFFIIIIINGPMTCTFVP